MVKEIQKLIAEHMELGYVSVKGFVEDAVRRRLEAIKGIATPTHDLERRKPMGTAKR